MSHNNDDQNNQDQEVQNEMDGHTYDGIRECDNPMPEWWIWTFFFTVVFALFYFIHYSVIGAPSLQEEFKEAMIALEKTKSHAPVLDETEQSLESAMSQSDVLALGASTFAGKCAVCHGNALQGQIGPNLTDAYWLNGKGTRLDIVKAIRQGFPDKGMPPWESMLSKNEIYGLAAFIISKQGSNPANPKAPQGEIIK